MTVYRTSFFQGAGSLKRASTNNARQTRQSLRVLSFQVRPYTTRKGDTIESIAKKRDFSVQDLVKLNHSTDVSSLEEGVTILLPADKLSDRDREIIAGIGRNYRTYPVRKGETLQEILDARNISMNEFKQLNPDTTSSAVKANVIIKLPKGKYTGREEEMLMGVARVPSEFFQSTGFMVSASIIGAGLAIIASFIVWWREKSKNE